MFYITDVILENNVYYCYIDVLDIIDIHHLILTFEIYGIDFNYVAFLLSTILYTCLYVQYLQKIIFEKVTNIINM